MTIEIPETRSFTADPYLDPNNVFIRDEVMYAGLPHGGEFELSPEQIVRVVAIKRGQLPTYAAQLMDWRQSSVAQTNNDLTGTSFPI